MLLVSLCTELADNDEGGHLSGDPPVWKVLVSWPVTVPIDYLRVAYFSVCDHQWYRRAWKLDRLKTWKFLDLLVPPEQIITSTRNFLT